MTNSPERQLTSPGSERPPSPLQPPVAGRHGTPPAVAPPTAPTAPTAPLATPATPPAPAADPRDPRSERAPADLDATLSRPTPRQLSGEPAAASPQPQKTQRPQAPAGSQFRLLPTESHGRGLDGPSSTTNEHTGPVPHNERFMEPGRRTTVERDVDELRPTAPHLDPRVANLTNLPPAKRRWFGRGFKAEPLPRNATSDALHRRIETPLRISVVGLKGGVGKTTSAILLARTIARARPEPVLLLDSDTTYGSLLLRLGTPPIASAHDIATMGDPGTLNVLNGVVARTADGVWVVPSGRNPAQSAAFSESTYVSAVRALYRYFPVSVTDCGTGIAGSLMRRVIEASHALVIATSASVDGVLSAHNALQWLISTGHEELAARSLVVMGNVPEQPKIDIAETKRGLEEICDAVVCVPSDPAVAPGGYIDFDALSPETRAAGHDLASLALDSAFRGGA